MRKLLFVATLALAGCGGGGFGGDARAVNDACMKSGGKPDYCTCMTKTLEASVTKEQFALIAKGGATAELDDLLDDIAKADAACPKG